MAMSGMGRSKPVGQQLIDTRADDFIVRVAEQCRNLSICKYDGPTLVDHDDGVGSGVEDVGSYIG